MTFIFNVLHKDFSVLAADKKGGASGHAQFTIGGTTVNVNSPKIVMNGLNKLFANGPSSLVAGMAGVTSSHTYVDELQGQDSIPGALAVVHKHVSRFYLDSDKAPLYRGEPTPENQALLCYFDEANDRFTTNVIKFSPIFMTSHMFHSTSVGLLHIGSGSVALEACIDVDKRKEFADSIANETDPRVCLDWIENAFAVVSEKAEGCGNDFVAYAATRSSPTFFKIRE